MRASCAHNCCYCQPGQIIFSRMREWAANIIFETEKIEINECKYRKSLLQKFAPAFSSTLANANGAIVISSYTLDTHFGDLSIKVCTAALFCWTLSHWLRASECVRVRVRASACDSVSLYVSDQRNNVNEQPRPKTAQNFSHTLCKRCINI